MSDDTLSASASVSPGTKIAGYRLEEQIGQGGMAVVYRAHDERLERRVALKLLAPSLASDAAFRTRFIRESRAAAAVDHPNIIPVYEAGEADGYLFIAMRYVHGGDVRSLLSDGPRLPAARVWQIITQVAAALDAAHAHDLIHRDVKPANMLLDTAGTTGVGRGGTSGEQKDHVYLSDFGISKQMLASHLTSTGQFVGTLDYIAPEQIEGQSVDGRADEYSLACAAFELLCAEPPFQRDRGLALINAHLSEAPPSVVARRPDLPGATDQVLARAMAKAPDRRYPTCSDFADDLGRALGLVPGAPQVGVLPAVGQGQDQAKPWPATALAAGVVGVGAAGVTNQPPQQPAAPTNQQVPQWPAGTPGGFDAATMYAPQQGTSGPQASGPPMAGPQTSGPQGGYAQWQGQPQQGGQQWQTGGQQNYQQYAPYAGYQQQAPQPSGPGWQQYPPNGPSFPGWQQPSTPPKKSLGKQIAVIAAAVVLVAAAVVAAVYLSKPHHPGKPSASGSTSPAVHNHQSTPAGGGGSGGGGATAAGEAAAIGNLLTTSEQSRSQWNSNVLVTDVGQCININSDVNQIGQIAGERSSELSQAQGLRVGLIANGATLKSQLVQALQISLNIDNEYLDWARQQQSSGCTVGTNSSYYSEATSQDSTATADKTTFVDTWNPIASQYGQPTFSADEI